MKKTGRTSNETVRLPQDKRFTDTLLNNLPGFAYRCENDRLWTLTYVSAGCEAIIGHNSEHVMATRLRWVDLIHVNDLKAARLAVNSALDAGQQFDIQYRIIDSTGGEKWVREQGCGVYSDNGNVEAIEGYIDDITPLRNAAQVLAQSEAFYEEEVRQKHERFSVTIENAPIGIVTYHAGGSFLSANHAFCEMTGYSVDELKGKTAIELTAPEDHSRSAVFMQKAQRGEIDTYSHRTRYVRKDGQVVDVSIVNAVTHDAAGHPNLIISQVADITAQLKAQSEIRRQHEHIAHADRLNTLGEMASGIAHEINQPLTAISLFAQTGRRLLETGNYDKLPEIFDKLSKHSRRAGAIVERMQDMSRRQHGTKQIIDLSVLIEDVVDLAEVDARTSNIVIDLDLERNLPKVKVDVVQIQQVTLNLLRNGMDAMRSMECCNGNTIQLITRLRDKGFLEVLVTDSGSGVSDEVAERLFESFSTTKSTGLGMGLPISNAIVTAHGGKLAFRNNEVHGATFSFTLPTVSNGDRDG